MMRREIGGTVLAALLLVGAAGTLEARTDTTTAPVAGKQSASSARRASAHDPVEILRALEARYRDIQTIKGAFAQTTVDATFGEKIESRGTFYLKKPSRLRIDYEPPYASTLLITDGYSYRYVPQLKQVERYRIAQDNTLVQTNYMLLGFGAATEDVLRAYKVSLGEPDKRAGHDRVVVALVPRQPDQAAFKSIEMAVDTQQTMPVEFRVTQLDATQTIVRLEPDKLVLDARTDDRLFRPSFPPEAQVVDMR